MFRTLKASLMTVGLAAATICGPAVANEAGGPVEKLLLNQPLEGWRGKESNIILIEAPAGFETPRHVHPGHIFIYVLEGSVELEMEGLKPQALSAGDAAYELPGRPMTGRNASASEDARILVFQIGDIGVPLEIPANQN